MKADQMTVEILPDGSLKITTDPVSAANHGGAEKMLLEMFKAIGAEAGDIETKHRHGKKYHGHSHSEGEHQHH